jgi:2-phosphosulfolactate phosphatase
MTVDVVLLPSDLRREHCLGRTVVVFDVLRATTSIAAALDAGVREIRVYPDVESARVAALAHGAGRLLCGETNCLPPDGFDLGNSPGAFDARRHAGRVMYLSTTNGTRAITAAALGAAAVFTGALVNADAAAAAARRAGNDVTLLCAGTNGEIADEDVLGAGAVLEALTRLVPDVETGDDAADLAVRSFRAVRNDLGAALRRTRGGRNVIAAGLEPDIDFAARLNVTDAVGTVDLAGAAAPFGGAAIDVPVLRRLASSGTRAGGAASA